MKQRYTEKQRRLLRIWRRGELKRINLLSGSVRSGKTWISLVLWAFWVAGRPAGGSYLMAAKTLTSLERNCLTLLQELVGKKNFTYSIWRKEGWLFGRRVHFEGVSDLRAEQKIRGLTLDGAYCDELTLFSEDFFTMLLSRLSRPGAKLFATTNPDSPYHWLKRRYIDRAAAGELSLLHFEFFLEDNTTLDPEYIENLKKEYTGVFYQRFVLGRWVNAQGLVYPMFDPARHMVDAGEEEGIYYLSVDYGTANPCAMHLWRVNGGAAVAVAEYYHDSRACGRQKTDEEYYRDLEQLAGGRVIQFIVADPSAASFLECIRRHGKYHVIGAENRVLDGIRVTAGMLSAGRVRFDKSCRCTRDEFYTYAWDENSHQDQVIKEHDHAMDSVRYFCYSVARRLWHWEMGGTE